MSCTLILSAHRSGSSLTASIIQCLGIHIGNELLGTHPSQPKGHHESVLIYNLNRKILACAGGSWCNPPSEARILAQEPHFRSQVKNVIAKSKRPKWGWKEPRTALLLPLYLPHLANPRFILVYRETSSIVNSLIRRGGGSREKWERLTRIYHESMEKYTQGHDVLRVQFEHLVSKHLTRKEVEYINAFVEGNGKIEKALSLIDFRI